MPIGETAADDTAGRKRFIRLERELHGGEPSFVSTIDADENKFLSGKASFNRGIDHTLFLASNHGDIGRCAAFVNHRYQDQHDEPVGFIGHFAAAPDASKEALELISTAEEWLGQRGGTRRTAPFHTPRQVRPRTAGVE